MSRPEDFDSDGSSQADAGRTQSQDAGRASGTDPNTENPVEELSEHGTQRTSGSFPSGTEVRSTEEAAQSEALPEHEAKRKSSSLQSGTEERGREEAAAQEEALRRDVDENQQEHQDTGRAAGTAPNAENLVEELSEHGAQRMSGSFQSGTEGRGTEEIAQNEALPEHEAKRKSSGLQSGTEERGREEAAAQEEALSRDVDENQQEHQDTGRAAGTAPNAENLVEELSEHGAQRTSGSFPSGTEVRSTEEAAQSEALPEHEAKRKSSSLQSGTEERGREEAAAQEEALRRDVDENQQEHQDTGRAAGTAPNAENLVEELSEHGAQRMSGSFQSGTEGRGTEEVAQNEALPEHEAKRKSSGLQSGTEERGREEAAAQEEALSRDVDENQQEHQDTGRAAGTAPNAENLVEELSERGAQRMSGSFQSGTEGRGTEEAAQNEALPEHEASKTEEHRREEADRGCPPASNTLAAQAEDSCQSCRERTICCLSGRKSRATNQHWAAQKKATEQCQRESAEVRQ